MAIDHRIKLQLKGMTNNAFKTRFSKDVFYFTKEIYQSQGKWGKIQTEDCQTKPGIINDPLSSPTPESRWSLLNRVKTNSVVIDYILNILLKEEAELQKFIKSDNIDIQDPDFIEEFFKILERRKNEFFDTSTKTKHVFVIIKLLKKIEDGYVFK